MGINFKPQMEEKALNAIQTLPKFKSKDGDADIFKECSSTNVALDTPKASTVPEALKDKLIRIKRNNDTRYLTLEDNGGQKTVALKAPFTGESQVWKIKQLDASGNIFGIVSQADESVVLKMNSVTNGCFIGSATDNAFAGTGVSITHDQEIGGYTIMLSTCHKYLNIFTDIDGSVVNSDLMWTRLDSVGWTVEVMNYLTYPCKVMNITQRHDGSFSHLYNSVGTPADYPIDEVCEGSPERSHMYCPCDEMEVKRIYGVGNSGTNTIWLRSTSPVITPSGEKFVVIMVTHPEDDDLSLISLGQKFKRGDKLFREGSDGFSTGNHFHISVGSGDIVGNGWAEKTAASGEKAYVITTDESALLPTESYFVNTDFTRIINSNGYTFASIP